MMARQDLRGEVMLLEHPLNPAVIDGVAIAVLDNLRQLARGEGMRDGQPHDVRLHGPREEVLHGGLAPPIGPGALIDQAQEASPLKAPQVPPPPPIIDAGPLALLPQGPLTLQHRSEGFIAGQGFGRRRRVMHEERKLRRRGRIAGHRLRLSQHVSRPLRGIYVYPEWPVRERAARSILHVKSSTSVETIRGHSIRGAKMELIT
jgi:hypothetical protein